VENTNGYPFLTFSVSLISHSTLYAKPTNKFNQQPPLPWIGGSEFSGIILATPHDTKLQKFKKGDRVFGSTQGAFAERVCVKEEDLQPIPRGWGFREAAALYLTGPTAHAAIDLRARTQPGMFLPVT
jgi:NADPH2:quinone reductase